MYEAVAAVHDSIPQQAPTAQREAAPARPQRDNRPLARGAQALQRAIDNSPRQVAQRQRAEKVAAARPNRTGLPDKLKAGVENLSGHSLDDVRVHYNSAKPAELQAHAYAQGTDIHVAPSQEQHLPHEAWHVVQQKQGRVRATRQMKGVGVNDSSALEKEADVMGAIAAVGQANHADTKLISRGTSSNTAQRTQKDAKEYIKNHYDQFENLLNPTIKQIREYIAAKKPGYEKIAEKLNLNNKNSLYVNLDQSNSPVNNPNIVNAIEHINNYHSPLKNELIENKNIDEDSIKKTLSFDDDNSYPDEEKKDKATPNSSVNNAMKEHTKSVRPVRKTRTNKPMLAQASPETSKLIDGDTGGYISDNEVVDSDDEFSLFIKSNNANKSTDKKAEIDNSNNVVSEKSEEAKKKWKERKEKLINAINQANKEIHDLLLKSRPERAVPDFYEAKLESPQNIRVNINQLEEASKEISKLTREKTRIASLSMTLLKYGNSKVSKGEKTPEVQSALVNDKSGKSKQVVVSGNNSVVNSALRKDFHNKKMSTAYKLNLRPWNIETRQNELEFIASKMNVPDTMYFKIDGMSIRNFEFKNKKFVGRDSNSKKPPKFTEEEFKKELKKSIIENIHNMSKNTIPNNARRSTRKIIDQTADSTIEVALNENNIHAESAILGEIKKSSNRIIELIGGTKVACIACQAFFTKSKHADLLGDNTSSAWLSKSSIKQILDDCDNATKYLVEIFKILQDRLMEKKLHHYKGSAGSYKTEDRDEESDVSTDSEEDEAMGHLEKGGNNPSYIDQLADNVIGHIRKKQK